MWKPVKLQGWGAGAVTLNARQIADGEDRPPGVHKVDPWCDRGRHHAAARPGAGADGFAALGPRCSRPRRAPASSSPADRSRRLVQRPAPTRVRASTAFTIVGAAQGGAIVLNGYTGFMNIGNNRLTGNAGAYGGGIRLGHPTLSRWTTDTRRRMTTSASTTTWSSSNGGTRMRTWRRRHRPQHGCRQLPGPEELGLRQPQPGQRCRHRPPRLLRQRPDRGQHHRVQRVLPARARRVTAAASTSVASRPPPAPGQPGHRHRHHRRQPDPGQPGRGRRRRRHRHRERQWGGHPREPRRPRRPGRRASCSTT